MPGQTLAGKLADIPLAKPGYDTLGMSAPIMIKINPTGKWEKAAPEELDEKRLQSIVDYLLKTNAVSAAQSYCCECCAENQKSGGSKANNYVPIIMMPISSADQCPFDMECEVKKMNEAEQKKGKSKAARKDDQSDDKKKTPSKPVSRPFVMQRLTDFDLLSQW